jgi:hypothetical protein
MTFSQTEVRKFFDWLASQDSNLGKRIQSPSCYRYTTRQYTVNYNTRERIRQLPLLFIFCA